MKKEGLDEWLESPGVVHVGVVTPRHLHHLDLHSYIILTTTKTNQQGAPHLFVTQL